MNMRLREIYPVKALYRVMDVRWQEYGVTLLCYVLLAVDDYLAAAVGDVDKLVVEDYPLVYRKGRV